MDTSSSSEQHTHSPPPTATIVATSAHAEHPDKEEVEDEEPLLSKTTTATTTDSFVSYSLLPSPTAPPFYSGLHLTYIVQLGSALDAPTSMEGAWTSHLRMSGVYWTLTALSLLLVTKEEEDIGDSLLKTLTTTTTTTGDNQDKLNILDWLFTCYHDDTGGFGGNTYQDAHLLYTLSALQILALCDKLDDPRLNLELTVKYIASLQQPDGSFVGDASCSIREIDTRFSYCAVSALSLLGRLDAINIEKAADYVAVQCRNDAFDGGFGCTSGAESHAGQVFCCIGALSICQRLDLILEVGPDNNNNNNNNTDTNLLPWWLSERQVDSGGLNGRPEKQSDVCYSWWILSSLSILGKVDWINCDKLASFILQCQDDEDGGIADRPDDMPDVFHTFFGIAGLSLLGHLHQKQNPTCRQIDPVYALPTDVVRRLGLQAQVIVSKGNAVDERLSQYNVIYQD